MTFGIGNPYQTIASAVAHPSRQLYTDSEVDLDAARPGAIGRLGGLGKIVATRAPWPVERVPLRAACGRYVDWVELNRALPAPG